MNNSHLVMNNSHFSNSDSLERNAVYKHKSKTERIFWKVNDLCSAEGTPVCSVNLQATKPFNLVSVANRLTDATWL